ncbi:MAG: helix-turn-helix transcriptional regulator [Anaerolineae bacterium]|nr:helix-turn-helix transcriptional regulator [Anaerolineae bacterium]
MTGEYPTNTALNFGETIRQLRRAQRLTQRELAESVQALGLKADFTYISKIENDRLEVLPSEALIRGLAQVLETDAETLLDLAGKFDQKALQNVAAEIPEVGILLRRLQTRRISQKQLKKFLADTA